MSLRVASCDRLTCLGLVDTNMCSNVCRAPLKAKKQGAKFESVLRIRASNTKQMNGQFDRPEVKGQAAAIEQTALLSLAKSKSKHTFGRSRTCLHLASFQVK